MSTLIHQRVEAARAGTNPTVLCRMPSGWAVLCDVQFLRGYSILLADPVARDLNELDRQKRMEYLLDMTILGDALEEVTGAHCINYEILGNLDAVLHAHVIPRYLTEPEALRKGPACLYDKAFRESVKFEYERDRSLMQGIAEACGGVCSGRRGRLAASRAAQQPLAALIRAVRSCGSCWLPAPTHEAATNQTWPQGSAQMTGPSAPRPGSFPWSGSLRDAIMASARCGPGPGPGPSSAPGPRTAQSSLSVLPASPRRAATRSGSARPNSPWSCFR